MTPEEVEAFLESQPWGSYGRQPLATTQGEGAKRALYMPKSPGKSAL